MLGCEFLIHLASRNTWMGFAEPSFMPRDATRIPADSRRAFMGPGSISEITSLSNRERSMRDAIVYKTVSAPSASKPVITCKTLITGPAPRTFREWAEVLRHL